MTDETEARKVTDAPERIWTRCEPGFAVTNGYLTTHPEFIEYVRADVHVAAIARAERAESMLKNVVETLEWAVDRWNCHNLYGDPMQGDWVSEAIARARAASAGAHIESAYAAAIARAEQAESERDEYQAGAFLVAKGSQDLRAMVDDCALYLKEGETPRQRMDRDHADILALMQMLAKDRTASDEALARAERAEAMLKEAATVMTAMRGNFAKITPMSIKDRDRISAAIEMADATLTCIQGNKPETDYERKVAQAKKDFPNGF